VTVCVAGIAEKGILVGASDRMLTAGDVEFEPDQSKIWTFSASIVALVSGDAGIQSDLLKEVEKQVRLWINKDPKEWVRVRDVVDLYCKEYRLLLRKRAESALLYPLGLTLESFLAKQKEMSPELVIGLSDKLSTFEMAEEAQTIFMGMDNDGPVGVSGEKLNYAQLYVLDRDKFSWATTVGFAAIGIGKFHAESQFMIAGHSPSRPFHETVFQTYAAKKRAEVAPGVGKFTDMVVIGPGLGSLLKIEDKHIQGLDEIYQRYIVSTSRITKRTLDKVKGYVETVKADYSARAEEQKREQSANKNSGEQGPQAEEKKNPG